MLGDNRDEIRSVKNINDRDSIGMADGLNNPKLTLKRFDECGIIQQGARNHFASIERRELGITGKRWNCCLRRSRRGIRRPARTVWGNDSVVDRERLRDSLQTEMSAGFGGDSCFL
jgi:hypothetical protein